MIVVVGLHAADAGKTAALAGETVRTAGGENAVRIGDSSSACLLLPRPRRRRRFPASLTLSEAGTSSRSKTQKRRSAIRSHV